MEVRSLSKSWINTSCVHLQAWQYFPSQSTDPAQHSSHDLDTCLEGIASYVKYERDEDDWNDCDGQHGRVSLQCSGGVLNRAFEQVD